MQNESTHSKKKDSYSTWLDKVRTVVQQNINNKNATSPNSSEE